MKTWNLDALYSSFESEAFLKDLRQIETLIEDMNDFAKTAFDSVEDAQRKLITYLEKSETLRSLIRKAYGFCSLTISTDTSHQTARKYMNKLQVLMSQTTYANTRFSKWVPQVDNLDELTQSNEALKDLKFYLQEIKEDAKHVLSDKEEAVISNMRQTSSTAWSQLQGELTSTLKVPYRDTTITLSEVRNKLFDKDPLVRKDAYEAEQAAYPQVEQAIAYAMNGIKGEVNYLSRLRGYESPLHQSIEQSRIKKATLDALLEAMKAYLPAFRSYLKRKAKLLGHQDALPYYDLFAPLGESSSTFTEQEAMDYIFKNFKSFSDDLEGLAKKAWRDEWIDFTPRNGKRGGAFCANLPPIKQSRILTNFNGSFKGVITLSHELGHAYHGEQIFKERILNTSYTMPVAETASTFCETIVKSAALKDAKGDEQLFILEQSLMGSTQIIVDIYSRYLFEASVFDERLKTPLDANTLKSLMLDAQKEAYGDALDEETMHPYAWLNKPHYYSGGLSFYNYPYAFGLLFAKGLYAKYLLEGDAFVKNFNVLLQKTGQMSVEDVAKIVDIDLTDPTFWKTSLDVIKKDIDLFLKITE